jgi:hypothetical protein
MKEIAGVITAVTAALAAYFSYGADQAAKEANTRAKQAEARLTDIQAKVTETAEQRAERESITERDKFVYQEVIRVLSLKRDGDISVPRQEQAVAVLINVLASPGLKGPLQAVFGTSATTPVVQQDSKKAAQFWNMEQEKRLAYTKMFAALDAKATIPTLAKMNVDVFYCEGGDKENERRSLATNLVKAVLSGNVLTEYGKWQARPLPRTVNDLPGYQISSNQVRFNPLEREEAAAKNLTDTLFKASQRRFELKQVAMSSPGYLSVFVCAN